jgi:hypothetical protein
MRKTLQILRVLFPLLPFILIPAILILIGLSCGHRGQGHAWRF